MVKGKIEPTLSGTPQGGVISPTLANFALAGMENYILDQPFAKKTKS
jgi:RNA-directed DNA polymerase